MSKNSIQFFGLPGSRKSSTLNALRERFPDVYAPVPPLSKIKRFALCVLFVIRFPRISIRLLTLLLGNTMKLWGYLFHLLSVSFAAHIYVILQHDAGKTLLIDEGVFQRLLSVVHKRLSPREAQQLVRMLYAISCTPLVMHGGDFDRFLNQSDRGDNPRNKLGETYMSLWTENLAHNFRVITDVLVVDHSCIEITDAHNIDGLNTKIRT